MDLDARFDFGLDEAKNRILALLDQVAELQPLKIHWVRPSAAQFYTADFSGAIVLTRTQVHISIDLPWYLSSLEASVEANIAEALAHRGFQLVPEVPFTR